MPKPFVLISLLILTASALCYESEARPIIVVYGGGEDEFATMLAELVEGEDRVDAEMLVVGSPEAVGLAAAMPNVACILIYADHKDDLLFLPEPLTAFFEGGGGLVGMTEVCNQPSAEELATDVFPVHGNHTLKTPPGTKRAFTYVLDQNMEIAEGLPETFEILGMGTYTSVDSEGDPLEVPGAHSVVYRDSLTDVPLLVAHQSGKGGRSVAMPGIHVVKNQRVDVYYGNLFLNENFTKLLVNSILWAMGNSRFAQLEQTIDDKVDEFNHIQEELKSRAGTAAKERGTRRTYSLAVAWAVGLVACGTILIKVVLSPQE
jgi:hypothetical protein